MYITNRDRAFLKLVLNIIFLFGDKFTKYTRLWQNTTQVARDKIIQ